MKKFIKPSVYFVMVIASWFTSRSDNWNTIHEQIIIVTSVIAAAVFVRLNRSLPIIDTDTLVEGQVHRITESYMAASKALGAHAAIVITTIAYSIFLLNPLNLIPSQCSYFNFLPEVFLCLLFGHVLIRSTDIIILDLDFAKLQSDFLDKKVSDLKKNRELIFEQTGKLNLDIPDNYGEIKTIEDSYDDNSS